MEVIRLEQPAMKHKEAVLDYLAEHHENGEFDLQGVYSLPQEDGYEAWLLHLEKLSSEETVPRSFVPATAFLAVRESDGRVIGFISIRHRLNDALSKSGGHIGYGVRPGERGKGYAARMLALALEFCRGRNIRPVLITCSQSNSASRRVIEKNGGVLEQTLPRQDGGTTLLYWIR
ncbi:MAG: GNAT family N-acetyltransferase [Clostridiales bacterium]|nr:GNAT family N-acetyltransferase [Clostridiales bacterium]